MSRGNSGYIIYRDLWHKYSARKRKGENAVTEEGKPENAFLL